MNEYFIVNIEFSPSIGEDSYSFIEKTSDSAIRKLSIQYIIILLLIGLIQKIWIVGIIMHGGQNCGIIILQILMILS